MMRRWLPELAAAVLLPCLLVQGKRTRRNTPRLPEAPGERQGIAIPQQGTQSHQIAQLIVIGESPVAGVGVASQAQALTAQLAQQLASRWQHAVSWKAYGKNGATVSAALRELEAQLPPPSSPAQGNHSPRVVLIAFGVNDSTAFYSHRRYRQDLQAMIAAVERQFAPDLIILSGAPPLHLFPALPQPLRYVLGLKAKVLTQVAAQLASERTKTLFVPVSTDTRDARLMASDGYHPSEAGAAQWAEQLAEAVQQFQTAPARAVRY